MRLLIELRDTTRELIQAQLEDMPDEVITELQAKLNRQYDHYHSKFGLINSRGASLDMRDDSGYFLLCSLENLDSEGNFIGKSDMFSKRTIRAARPAERVETASEALALSVGERAGIDFATAAQCYAEVGNEEYLHQMALAVSVEVCGRLGISPPADAADRLNGLRAHIPAGEERRALEEVREMAKVFGDTVCKELDLQRPRSDLQRTGER